MSRKSKVLLFGASLRGLQVLSHVRDHCNVIGFIDNDINKQGLSVSGIMVYAPSMIMELNPDIIFISSMYSPEIHHQIVQLGFPARKIRNASNKYTAILNGNSAIMTEKTSSSHLTHPVNLIISNPNRFPSTVLKHAQAIAQALSGKYADAVSSLDSLIDNTALDPLTSGTAVRIHGILRKASAEDNPDIMNRSGWNRCYERWLKNGLAPSLEKTVLVSIIVPVYNTEPFLAKCLDTLTGQTLDHIEIIVVNDESPDQSQKIIDEYRQRFPEIIVALNKKNGGLSSARNHGIQFARGRYIGFVDSDDFVEKNMFANLYDAAHLNQLQIAIGQYFHYPIGGRITVDSALLLEDSRVYHGRDFLLQSNVMVVWNKLYERDFIKDYSFPVTWFEDVAWSPVVMSYAKRIGYVPQPFYHYIRRDNAQTAAMTDPRTLQGITALQYALKNCNPDEREAVVFMAFRRLLFEGKHRIAYADRYYTAVKELGPEIAGNRYIKDNRWLCTQSRKLINGRPVIPKVLYYGNFASTSPTTAQKICEASWLQKLMFTDGQIQQLNENNCNIGLNPAVQAAYEKGNFKLVGDYFRLKAVCENGGIAIIPNLKANAFITKKLVLAAFFSYDDNFEIFDGLFAAVPRHEVTMLALKKMDVFMQKDPQSPDALSRALKESLSELYHFQADGSFFSYGGQTFVYPEEVFFSNMGNNDEKSLYSNCNITQLVTEPLESSSDSRVTLGFESLRRYIDRRETTVREEMNKKVTALFSDAEELNEIHRLPFWKTYARVGRFLEEFRKYRQASSMFHHDQDLARRARYAQFLNSRRIDERLVLFESFYGRGLLSSPNALFLGWQRRPDFHQYRFVWVLDDLSKNKPLIGQYRTKFRNVTFVSRGSIEYLRCLASARYLINDVSFFFDFIKRSGQTYINTWHSITVKTLGFDIPGKPLDQKNVIRNFLACDYFLSPNAFMREKIFLQTHMMDGLYSGKIVEEGHPRDDLTFSCSRKEVIDEWINAGVKISGGKKIIMYAPTWRGTNVHAPSDDINEYKEVIERIRSSVDAAQYDVVLRVHHLADAKVKKDNRLKGLVVPSAIDANRCFRAVDILITDYSSIYFDFLVTGNPVLFYIRDLESYQKYRGVYFSPDELPGPATADLSELIRYIIEIDSVKERFRKMYEATRSWACPHEDGHVSARVLSAVIDGQIKDRLHGGYSQRKKKVLFYAGALLNTPATSSLFTILQKIDRRNFDISVLIDDRGSTETSRHAERLLQLGCRPIGRSEHCVFTALEYYCVDACKRRIWKKNWRNRLVVRAMKREWLRCMGQASFDYIVNLDNESPFHAHLLLNGSAEKKIAFKRFDENRMAQTPSQRHIASTYRMYDSLASDESEIISAIGAAISPCTVR